MKAAEVLIKDGFEVMVYTNDDPIVAKELEQMGCVCRDAAGCANWFRFGNP